MVNSQSSARWVTFSMTELYKLLNKEKSSVFIKPTFPTRRWGQIHLKESTTDKKAVERCIEKLKENGITCRKRLCKESMTKFPKLGKFYKIEIKQQINEL